MAAKTPDRVDRRILQQLQDEREQREFEEKMRLVRESYGEDQFEDGRILSFTKQYDADPVLGLPAGEYTYAALKVGGWWYLTGTTGRDRYSWDELRAFWASGIPVRRVYLMVAGRICIATDPSDD